MILLMALDRGNDHGVGHSLRMISPAPPGKAIVTV